MSATGSDATVALYQILVNGTSIDPTLAKSIREIKVQNYLRLPDMCTFVVGYPKAEPGQDQPIDSNPFDIGATLEVKLGAADDSTTTSLFVGQIVSLELNFGAGGVELLCRGYDRSLLLTRSRNAQTFQNMTSSDIVSKVVQAAGLTPDTDDSGDPHDFMQQDNETDWDFIWRLAERVGFEFVVDGTTAHFRKPVADNPIQLSWPDPLRSFKPRVTAVQQVGEVTLATQDPKTNQAISVTANSVDNQISNIGVDRHTVANAFSPAADIHVATEPVKSQSEGTTLAQALLDKLANGYIAAEGICAGNPDIKTGIAVQVSGLGTKYSGTYRVAAVTHVLRGGATYETHFASSASQTLLGAVGGGGNGAVAPWGSQLVLGLVTNNDDPDNWGKVRVQYPSLGGDVEGAWARIASVGAGATRGVMMLPQVGDEVLVGFEHGDTTRPYVLGALFNSQSTPDSTNQISSQDGSFTVLSDAQFIAIAQKAMKLTSNDDFTLTANNITLTGNQAVSIQGQSGTTIQDQQSISIQGKTGTTIQDQVSISISCSGSSISIGPSGVTISGPMISLGS